MQRSRGILEPVAPAGPGEGESASCRPLAPRRPWALRALEAERPRGPAEAGRTAARAGRRAAGLGAPATPPPPSWGWGSSPRSHRGGAGEQGVSHLEHF